MKTLGDRIRELRTQKQLTQAGLAKKTGISLTQMARYETKGIQPPADILKKLTDIFGTTVDYLVSGAMDEKAKVSLRDTRTLEQYKELDVLPENEKNTILKVVNALIRDFKARQTYVIA